jgi:signal transduction histidine kinase
VSLTWKDRPSIVVGWALVAAIALAITSAAVGTALGTTIYRVPVALSFLVAVFHAAAIALAIPRPIIAAAITVISAGALAALQTGGGHAPWPWAITTLVTHAVVLALIGSRTRIPVGLSAWAAASAATILVTVLHLRSSDEAAINIIIATSVSGVALALGLVAREWRGIRSQLVHERAMSADEHERRVVAEEKTRISRELHDVVVHSMSIINVQASSAGARHPGLGGDVRSEFEDIAAASRRALAEMRSLLSVLRDDGAPRQLAPQPTLSRIPELVEQSVVSGTPVRLTWIGSKDDRGVSEATGLAAYRIVQEALSNVIRHAPGAAVEVRCDRGTDSIAIAVESSRPTSPGTVEGSSPGGQGLLGMRERAASVGGTVEYGATPSGGYLVRAHLPLDPAWEEQ